MTDKELVEKIIKQCKGHSLANGHALFNANDQCTRLNLWAEKLKEIPKEIYKLKHLTYLDLRFNNIKEIPKLLMDSIDKILYDDTNVKKDKKDKIMENIFNPQHVQLVNKSDLKFIDINTELYREYTFITDSGIKVKQRYDNPLKLHVSKSGGHRLFMANGHCHYIPSGWIGIEWIPKKDEPHFVA